MGLTKLQKFINSRPIVSVIGGSEYNQEQLLERKQNILEDLTPECEKCKLYNQKDIYCPLMEPRGYEGGVVIVGESPGETEDSEGKPFVGPSGLLLNSTLSRFGIKSSDCYITNAFQCRPPKNVKKTKPKTDMWARFCNHRLKSQILNAKPKLIIALGAVAMRAVMEPPKKVILDATSIHGVAMPSHQYGCWVCGCFHPSYILNNNTHDMNECFKRGIASSLLYYDQPIPKPLARGTTKVMDTMEDIQMMFTELMLCDTPVAFDYETVGTSPYKKDAQILCASFAYRPEFAYFLPLGLKDWTPEQKNTIRHLLVKFFTSSVPKVAQNFSFEYRWTMQFYHCDIKNFINDTMVSEHILDSNKHITGLKYQVFRHYGDVYDDNINVESLIDAPLNDIVEYNGLDARYTILRHIDQMQKFSEDRFLKRGHKFFMKAIPVLALTEHRGLNVDLEEVKHQKEEAEEHINIAVSDLQNSGLMDEVAKKRKITEINLSARDNIKVLLYDILGLKAPKKTPGGDNSVDKESISILTSTTDNEQAKWVFERLNTLSIYGTKIKTFLDGYISCLHDDGKLHPGLLLNTTRSYRSSSAKPNMQNFPKRNELQSEFRKVMIPDKGDFLLEVDASGSEIVVIAMLSKDPILIKQLQDKYDLHRYWASKLFKIPEKDITKEQRYQAKNGFVFPEYYGSYYESIAKAMKLPVNHVQDVEQEFWKIYEGIKKWQDGLIKDYSKTGYVEMPFGFRRHGPLSNNKIINTPVQGTSFHMLLWSMIKAEEDITKAGTRSRIIGEVHDSIVVDFFSNEADIVIPILHKRMTEKQFYWQGEVPRGCEISIGLNWKDISEV